MYQSTGYNLGSRRYNGVSPIRYTERHFKPKTPKPPEHNHKFLCLYDMVGRVKNPNHNQLQNALQTCEVMLASHLLCHPAQMLDALSENISNAPSMADATKYINADGTIKSFRVMVKGIMCWRTALESPDIIQDFDETAHSWAFDNNLDIGANEHEEYISAMQKAIALHKRYKDARKSIKRDIELWEAEKSRLERIMSEIKSNPRF